MIDYTIKKELQHYSVNKQLVSLLGLEKAFLLSEIIKWLETNKKDDRHQREGAVWTYGSYDYWFELYPFISRRAIEIHLSGLVKDGWLEARELSAKEGNRKKWYTAGPSSIDFFYTPSRKNEVMVPQDTPSRKNEDTIPQKRGDGSAKTTTSACASLLPISIIPQNNTTDNTLSIPQGGGVANGEMALASDDGNKITDRIPQGNASEGKTGDGQETIMSEKPKRSGKSKRVVGVEPVVTPPASFAEFAQFVDGNRLAVDAASVYSTYEASKWFYKNNGKPVLNWKAMVSGIARRNQLDGQTYEQLNCRRLKNKFSVDGNIIAPYVPLAPSVSLDPEAIKREEECRRFREEDEARRAKIREEEDAKIDEEATRAEFKKLTDGMTWLK